ncbi:MAG: hypothetical protein H0W47_17020 [Polaromonas sp.]|nr:hypothetical protein [Polaromonas sp.]
MCLQCDEVPYYRRSWRLACVTACTTHGVALIDTCLQCRSPVMPHRVDIGRCGATPRNRSFIRCWNCGSKLSAGAVERCGEDLLAFIRHLEGVLQLGFVHSGSHFGLHSIPYFAGLRVLARVVGKQNFAGYGSIERLPVGQRHAVMGGLSSF